MAKKKHVWHETYYSAILLGVAIIVLSLFIGVLSPAGMLISASAAASLIVVLHKRKHHLTTVGTVTMAYFVSAILGVGLIAGMRLGGATLYAQSFAVLLIIGYILYWLNIFHPPAITFAMAYIYFLKGVGNYIYVLFATIALLIVIRFLVYVKYEHLTIRKFAHEFIRQERKILRKEEGKIRKSFKRA